MVACAVAVGIRDAREGIIANTSCMILAAAGVLLQMLRIFWPDLLAATLWGRIAPALAAPEACLLAALAMLVLGTAAELLWRHVRGHAGMGLGDVKYLAAWTAVLGIWAVAGFVAAALLGGAASAVRGRTHFPLGPYLSAAELFLCLLIGIGAVPHHVF